MNTNTLDNLKMVLGAAIFVCFDAAVSIGVAVLVDRDPLWLSALVVFAALQVVYFFVWLRKNIVSSIAYKLYGRKHIVNIYLDLFKNAKFPEPPGIVINPSYYFTDVAEDESLSRQLNREGSFLLAALQASSMESSLFEHAQLELAIREAMSLYKATFNSAQET